MLFADLVRRYYEEHAQHLSTHDTARNGLNMWLDFFPPDATAKSASSPQEVERFIRHLQAKGFSNAYINRILTSGKAALNRAWKQGLISSAPFIRSLSEKGAEPLGRPLELEEVRLFYHTADSERLKRFVLWMLGTAARPDAILELHRSQIDEERGLIHLNPPGRAQTKKYRPTVRLPGTLPTFIGDDPYLFTYRDKPVASIRRVWRDQRKACGFDNCVNPYSLRHTMARHLRASGVPAWEVAAQLGHKQPGMAITEIYAPYDPSYLTNAAEALDTYLRVRRRMV